MQVAAGGGAGQGAGMIKIADIRDRESLREWLEGQPQEVSIWIVHRCAMRLLPEWWEFVLNSFVAEHADLSALQTLQHNLISGFASKILTAEARYAATAAEVADDDEIMGDVIEAALSASVEDGTFSKSTYSELGTATNAAHAAEDAIKTINAAAYGVYAANAVTGTSLDYWALIESDCAAILTGDDRFIRPLWGDQNNQFEKKWKA